MADKNDKRPESVTGKFYVDSQCIDCDLCRETAPKSFTRQDDGGYSYVFAQPTDQEGIDKCMEALEGCPVASPSSRWTSPCRPASRWKSATVSSAPPKPAP